MVCATDQMVDFYMRSLKFWSCTRLLCRCTHMSSRSDDVPVHIVPPPTKRRRIHTHNSSRSTRDSRTTQIVTLSTGSSGRLRQRRTHKTSALRVVDPDREIEAWTSSAHDNTSGENVEQPSDDNAQKVDKPKGAARTVSQPTLWSYCVLILILGKAH